MTHNLLVVVCENDALTDATEFYQKLVKKMQNKRRVLNIQEKGTQEKNHLTVRLVTRSTIKTRRWIDASGHGIQCVFAQRSREIGQTDAKSSIAGGMFVKRSAVATGEFGTMTERSQIVLASIANVSY